MKTNSNNIDIESTREIQNSIKNLINTLDKSKQFDIENIILSMNPYFENLEKMIDKSYVKSLEYHKILNKMESKGIVLLDAKEFPCRSSSPTLQYRVA